MPEQFLQHQKQRHIRGLLCLLVFATVFGVCPAQAHIGVAEEIEEVTALLRANPDATELYLLRGDLHRINAHWPEAMADFDRVRRIDPTNAQAELGLGKTRLDQGMAAEALVHLNRAIALQPDNVRALVARAKAARLGGNPLAAAADYTLAIDTFNSPDTPLPEYYLERARAFDAAGSGYIDAAIRSLDEGTKQLGGLRVLEDYAIELERKRGNYTAALGRLDRILEQSARKESLLSRRGDILLQSGQRNEAEVAYAAALSTITLLPARQRNSRLIQQLRLDIESRSRQPEVSGEGE